jgi:prepilin-type N-terminal cleavage/methylation domain-containing protein
MSKDGYTLVEMLAALAILGLAFGGLVESGRVIGALQRDATASARAVLAKTSAAGRLDGLLRDAGPFFSDDASGFDGAPTRFSFECDQGRCGGRIETGREGSHFVSFEGARDGVPIRLGGRPSFRYADDSPRTSYWPQGPFPRTVLRSVTIADERANETIAAYRLDTDEPPSCVFDVVSQACRRPQ